MSALLGLDAVSGIGRVSAQATWGALREALAPTGWGLQRSALHPAAATVRELLEQRSPGASPIFAGELRQSIVSLMARHGDGERYEYTPAPRKSSGPDLRYLFIGGRGTWGQIEEVGLQLWPRTPGRLIEVGAGEAEEAARVVSDLVGLGLRMSWSWWTPGRLEVAFHAPAALLAAQEATLRELCGDELTIHAGEHELARRVELEAALPTSATQRRCAHADAARGWRAEDLGIAWDSHDARIYTMGGSDVR